MINVSKQDRVQTHPMQMCSIRLSLNGDPQGREVDIVLVCKKVVANSSFHLQGKSD